MLAPFFANFISLPNVGLLHFPSLDLRPHFFTVLRCPCQFFCRHSVILREGGREAKDLLRKKLHLWQIGRGRGRKLVGSLVMDAHLRPHRAEHVMGTLVQDRTF